ncbi:MULE domain-containing protein [Aphis craccivora]|uniref:MULE domain-containing protein n=1 Tax=Aphis craccivora TaxID=307492 RepID=A0A6G0ZFW7_APHCR|nr:MULE domain-containing protein [Aphis craccivora]
MEIKTNVGEQFLFVNDKENSIVGFYTEQNIKILCDVKKIYVDGMFKSGPKNCIPLFTIHGLKNEVYLPLVFFFTAQQVKYYIHVCISTCIIRYSISIGVSCFNILTFFIDFEPAIHSATAEVFPNAKIRGCRFHLGKSCWRKNNTDDSHYLKYFFGLPFLEPENVIDCFTDDFMAIQPAENDQMVKFTDCIFENYISADAMFPWTIPRNSYVPLINQGRNSYVI